MLKRIKNAIGKAEVKSRKLFFLGNEPNFLILGAQKAGTSSLHYYLAQHPMLSGGIKKELGYFHRDIFFGKSFSEYKSDLSGPKHKIYFEATPEYLSHPGAAKNIHEKLPNAKLIILLRDPITRAYSAWNHYKQHFETGQYVKTIKNKPRLDGNLLFEKIFCGREEFPTFRECIDIEFDLIAEQQGFEPAILRRGLYLEQIEEYWQFFDANQILILGFKDFIENTNQKLNEICRFIGVDEIDWSTVDREPRNTRQYVQKIKAEDQMILERFYAEPNRKLFERIGEVNW